MFPTRPDARGPVSNVLKLGSRFGQLEGEYQFSVLVVGDGLQLPSPLVGPDPFADPRPRGSRRSVAQLAQNSPSCFERVCSGREHPF